MHPWRHLHARARSLPPAAVGAVFILLAMASLPAGAAKERRAPRMAGEAIVLENEVCRYTIGSDGQNRSFVDRATGKEYCTPGFPVMIAGRGNQSWPATGASLEGETLVVTFGESGLTVKLDLAIQPRYFRFTVADVAGAEVDWVQLANLRLEIRENVGTLVNAAWNAQFGACLLACSPEVDSAGADQAQAHLYARVYRQYGMKGEKFALFGIPTGGPDPAEALLDAIGAVELAEGLPHPMLNGVWIKKAKERFASYLMVHNLGEANADPVIEFARGGFGCIEIYPWASMPSCTINKTLFPNGLEGLKRVADKIHAAGLQLGLHSMQAMVGWGGMHDPYVCPKADPRLLQDRHATLAEALDDKATEVRVQESTEGWPEKGDLYLEGEILRYGRLLPNGFAECERGLHGTTVGAHAAGTRLGHLVNCFNMWGNVIYAPDVNTTLIDEVCERIAHVFNETGCDMAYFDGGEEVLVQPPYWRNQGRVALGVTKRLKKPIILEGNALYTHHSWHVITRGSPSFDPIFFGRREYTLRHKGQNPAGHAKNLLTGDVGWFAPHIYSPSTDAVTPDEVLLLCLKALGGKSPISFQADANNLWANKRMPEMLQIIRACDELKRRDYFTEAACAELARPMAEHTLEQTRNGEWNIRPLQFGPPRVVNASAVGPARAGLPEAPEWEYLNPYDEQAPWVRLRARTRLSPYGAEENVVLADPATGVPFKVEDSAAAELVHSAEPSTEKAPDGSPAFCFRATNKSAQASGWCRLALPFPEPLNLSQHRRLGLWVHSEGKGGILNVQLCNTYGYKDHYIPLDFTGWSYRELDPPEDMRFWNYSWPYNFIDLFYWPFRYHEITGINLYYNGLPANAETVCLVGRIEALREHASPLRAPALEAGGQRITFPVALQPEEYLEVDWAGRCRHFERNGGLLGEVRPQGRLRLAAGTNRVRFTCADGAEASTRAEVTLCVRGEPLPGARRARAKERQAAGRYPTLAEAPPPEALTLPGDGRGGFRVVYGVHEVVSRSGPRDGGEGRWSLTHEADAPSRAAVVLARAKPEAGSEYDDPKALVLESFDALDAYELSDTNQFEKYVVGQGKELGPTGPVRAGVTQSFTPATDDAKVGRACGVFTATNAGEAGGWCAKGKRLPKPLDLSGYPALGLWVHGDGQGEAFVFQLRDTAGRYANWTVPITFTGWRLQRFTTAEARDFDWKQVEYVLFYYNNLPAQATCTLKLDDLKALPPAGQPKPLRGLSVTVGEARLEIPVALGAGEAIAIDPEGRLSVWADGKRRGRARALGQRILLRPGANQVEVRCGNAAPPAGVLTVQVLPLGPA